MKIYNSLENFSAHNPVVTIGIFDGVHLGHQQILNRLNEFAGIIVGETVVFTFWPHPKIILYPNDNFGLLSSLEEKISLIEKFNINHLIIFPFTKEFAGTTFNEFIQQYLVKGIKASQVVIGYNHHFGKDRKGGYEELKKSAEEQGFGVERLNQVLIENSKVSSSTIRQIIANGDVYHANNLLGYRYFIQGKVIKGMQIGRKLGFPTANLELDEPQKLLPSNGVYAVKVFYDKKEFNGMLNIGYRPTIAEQLHNKTIEVNIFDFNKTIYEEELKIEFVKRIRDEIKFKDVNDLKERLSSDKEIALYILLKI